MSTGAECSLQRGLVKLWGGSVGQKALASEHSGVMNVSDTQELGREGSLRAK